MIIATPQETMIINRHDLDRVFDSEIVPRLKKFTDYRLKKHLGQDHYGMAFEVGFDKVLKITSDYDEARTSSKLIDHNLKQVVKIYKVFQFKTLKGVYFIVEEKLLPLSSEESNVIGYLGMDTKHLKDVLRWVKQYNSYKSFEDVEKNAKAAIQQSEDAIVYLQSIWDSVLRDLDPLTVSYIIHKLSIFKPVDFIRVFAKQNFRIIEKALLGLKEMVDHHITFEDTKPDNLMKDAQGMFKWIDLGGFQSSAPGEERIEQTQGHIKEKRK